MVLERCTARLVGGQVALLLLLLVGSLVALSVLLFAGDLVDFLLLLLLLGVGGRLGCSLTNQVQERVVRRAITGLALCMFLDRCAGRLVGGLVLLRIAFESASSSEPSSVWDMVLHHDRLKRALIVWSRM